MIETVRKEVEFLSPFQQQHRELAAEGPRWLQEARTAALNHFLKQGFPTTGDEEWKYTNLTPVAATAFRPAGRPAEEFEGRALEALPFASLNCPRVTFLDGVYHSEWSNLDGLPEGVEAGSLAEILRSRPEVVEAQLGRYAGYQENIFSALNLALFQDGACVRIAPGLAVETPLQLLFVTTGREKVATFPRVLVLAGRNSQVKLMESYLSLGDSVHLTAGVTELVLGENAVVDHYKLQAENLQAFHIHSLKAWQDRSSSLRTQVITLGAALSRNNVTAVLDGEGADCGLNGLYLVRGDQHVDNHTRLDHARPHCSSRELYKGALDDRATGVFHGRIVVHRDAQKTDSKQTNKNLLLSNEALINTKPQLEIYADDVKCTHGATIGQLDADAIFYLRSRGIDERTAYSLLIYAFAGEVVDKIRVEALHQRVNDYLFDWLPRGDLVREAV